MSQANKFAAQILEASAAAYAGYAASLLLERHPDLEKRYAPAAMSDWKAHLTQRVLELAAALGAEEPQIFASRVVWAGKSFRARDLDDEDLHQGLLCLREVLGEELPGMARDTVSGYLETALNYLQKPLASHRIGLDPSEPSARLALQYLQAVLDGHPHRAIDLVVEAVDEGLSTRDAYIGVLIPALQEVGNMWHIGELNIAEEHFVTATTERAMSILAHRAKRAEPIGKTMIAAAVAGNTHGLGARILADFFELAGWNAICLSADVPATDIANSVVYFNADLVVLSAALSTQLKAVNQTMTTLRSIKDREIKVLVGGSAFDDAPDLWQRIGADGYAPRADKAVGIAAEFFDDLA